MLALKHRFRLSLPHASNGTLVPALLAATLAALAIVQCAFPQGDQEALPVAPMAPVTRFGPLEISPVSASPAIVAGNLFAPSRGSAAMAGADTPLGGATIAGTIRVGSRLFAIVSEPSGVVHRISTGASIAGWRVGALFQDHVRLSREGKTIDVPYGASTPAATSQDSSEESGGE